jgi:4'-phosphopantetheinyl transferase
LAQSNQKVKPIADSPIARTGVEAKKPAITVLVWPLDVSAERQAELYAILTPGERAKADRLRRSSVKQRFTVSRAVTRELLASYCGCTPGEIRFGASAFGKPHLTHPLPGVAFNHSHTVAYGALALGEVGKIGLDIEVLRPSVDDLAESIFTPGEAAQLSTVSGSDRVRVLFRAWVAKEAYLKATGEGLSGGLTSLELDLTVTADIRPLAIRGAPASLANWQFHAFDVGETVVGAVAIEADGPVDVDVRHISAEQSPACSLLLAS